MANEGVGSLLKGGWFGKRKLKDVEIIAEKKRLLAFYKHRRHVAQCSIERQQRELERRQRDFEAEKKLIIEHINRSQQGVDSALIYIERLEKELKVKKEKPKPIIEEPTVTEVIEETQTEVIKEMKEAINSDHKEIVNGNKVKCPECLNWFTKGGAFASHYKTHFPNGD